MIEPAVFVIGTGVFVVAVVDSVVAGGASVVGSAAC